MRRSVSIIFYGVTLYFLPILEIVVIAPLVSQPWVVVFPLVATVAFVTLPRRAWWVATLVGALWHDVLELAPYGASLAEGVVLGICLTLLTNRLTSRSFWSDCLVVMTAVAISTLAIVVVLVVTEYFGWRVFVITPSDFAWEFVFTLLIAALEAAWLRRYARRHQYVS